jgi:hypothetical protein
MIEDFKKIMNEYFTFDLEFGLFASIILIGFFLFTDFIMDVNKFLLERNDTKKKEIFFSCIGSIEIKLSPSFSEEIILNVPSLIMIKQEDSSSFQKPSALIITPLNDCN